VRLLYILSFVGVHNALVFFTGGVWLLWERETIGGTWNSSNTTRAHIKREHTFCKANSTYH